MDTKLRALAKKSAPPPLAKFLAHLWNPPKTVSLDERTSFLATMNYSHQYLYWILLN